MTDPAPTAAGPAFEIAPALLDRHPDLLVAGFRASNLRAAAAACGDPEPAFAAARAALAEAGVTLQNPTFDRTRPGGREM